MTFYQNSQAILACYDINDKGSFEGMKTWLKEAKKFSEGNSVVYVFCPFTVPYVLAVCASEQRTI